MMWRWFCEGHEKNKNMTDLLSWSSSSPPQFSIKHTILNKPDWFGNLEILNVALVSLNLPKYPFQMKKRNYFHLPAHYSLMPTPMNRKINKFKKLDERFVSIINMTNIDQMNEAFVRLPAALPGLSWCLQSGPIPSCVEAPEASVPNSSHSQMSVSGKRNQFKSILPCCSYWLFVFEQIHTFSWSIYLQTQFSVKHISQWAWGQWTLEDGERWLSNTVVNTVVNPSPQRILTA